MADTTEWVLVPVSAEVPQITAIRASDCRQSAKSARAIYRAMVAARPPVPASEVERIARVIEGQTDCSWDDCRFAARAVLAALGAKVEGQ